MKTWKEYAAHPGSDGDDATWVGVAGAAVVQAGVGAAQAARAEVARLEAEARVQAHSVGDVELG